MNEQPNNNQPEHPKKITLNGVLPEGYVPTEFDPNVARLSLPEGATIPEFDLNVATFRLTKEERERLKLQQKPPLQRIAEALERHNQLFAEFVQLQKKGN